MARPIIRVLVICGWLTYIFDPPMADVVRHLAIASWAPSLLMKGIRCIQPVNVFVIFVFVSMDFPGSFLILI